MLSSDVPDDKVLTLPSLLVISKIDGRKRGNAGSAAEPSALHSPSTASSKSIIRCSHDLMKRFSSLYELSLSFADRQRIANYHRMEFWRFAKIR